MNDPAMTNRAVTERALFLYDGDCAFCSTCAQFIDRRIPTDARVAAWQHVDLRDLPVSQEDCEESVQWIGVSGIGVSGIGVSGIGVSGIGVSGIGATTTAGPQAIADLLKSSTAPWKTIGTVLALSPVQLVARPVYRIIARNRDKLPGGTPTCALPQAERDKLSGDR